MARGKIDFEDTNFEMDDDFGDFNAPKVRHPKTAREAIAIAGPSVLDGVKDAATDPQAIRDILGRVLPRSFTYAMDEVDSYASSYDQLQRQLSKEARPAITAMGKLAKRINGIIPHPFQSKLDSQLDRFIRNDSGGPSIDPDEAAIEAGLRDGMGDIEGVMTEDGRAEAVITKIDERNYRVGMYNALSELRSMTRQYTQYQFTQNRAYQRKVLEVQLRQLMTQRKILERQATSSVEISNLLRDIVKNTGLPEYAKEHANEAFRRTSREMLFGAVQRPIADWSRNYIRSVTGNMGRFMRDRLGNFREGATNADEQVQAFEEQMKMARELNISPWEVFGGMGGDALFRMLGGVAADKVRKVIPYKGGIDNAFSYATQFMRNIPYLANEMGRKRLGSNKFLDQLLSNFAVGHDTDHTQVVRGSALGSITGMSPELRSARALEEIIPGYLSRMLHIMDKTYTGNPDAPRVVYNREKGQFTSLRESANDLEKAIISNGALKNQAYDVGELLDALGVSKSDGALRAVMSRHLLKQSQGTSAFRVEDFVNDENIEGMTPRQRKRLRNTLVERFKLSFDEDKDRYTSGIRANNALILDAQSRYRRLQQGNISMFNKVHAAMQTGNMDELIELGVVRYDPESRGWVIDPKYKEGRLDEAVVGDLTGRKVRRKRVRGGNPADLLNAAREGGDSGSMTGNEMKIGRGGVNAIRSAIRAQTEELVEQFQHLVEIGRQQVDQLATIEQRFMEGIDVKGFGVSLKSGALGRGLGKAFRGARWAGKKMWDVTGLPFRGARWMARKSLTPLWGGLKNWVAGKDFAGKIDKLKTDVYVMGEAGFRKAIDAIGFAEGRYTNMVDGSPIRSIRDIKGAVYDTVLQKQIISQEEFENGLLNSVGKRIFGGAVGMATTMVTKAAKLAMTPFTATWRGLKRGTNMLASTLMAPPDIYVPGEESPRILGDIMFKGKVYYSGATGSPLRYLGDIDGEIVTFDKLTGERKVVITQDEVMKGLVDQYGKPLTPFLRKVRKAIEAAKRMVGKAFRAPKVIWDWARKQFKSAGQLVGKGLSSILNMHDNRLTQVYWLQRIYRLMYLKYTGQTVGEDKDLAVAMGSITTSAGAAISTAGAKIRERVKKATEGKGKVARKKALEIIEKVEGTTAVARARKVRDELKKRTGSWVNEAAARTQGIRETLSRQREEGKREGKSWLPLLLSGVGTIFSTVIGGLTAKITSGFGFLKGFLERKLPWLMMKAATQSGAGDLADNMAGGKWGRRLGKLGNKLKASKLGRIALGAGRLGGRVLAGFGVNAALGGGASAATAAAGAAGAASAGAATAGAAAGAAGAAGAAAAGGGILSAVGSGMLAVGSFLMSPWVLGVAAAGLAAYGLYKLYKNYSSKRDFELSQKLRLVQYGLQLDSQHDDCAKVLGLEAELQQAVQWRDGQVAFDSKRIDMNAIAQLFGVTAGAGRNFVTMQTWLTNRFLPIYGAWLQAAKTHANVDSVDNLDGRVAPAVMRSIISASYLGSVDPNRSPYWVAQSPIPGYWCIQGLQRIDATITEAYRQLDAQVQSVSGRAKTVRVLGAAEGFKTPGTVLKRGVSLLQPRKDGEDERLDNYYGAAERLTKGKITGNIVTDAVIAKFNEIDDLTALRMKVYGLTKLQKAYVDVLQRFEMEVARGVKYTPDGKVSLAFASPADIYSQYCGMFGLERSDKEAAQVFIYWLKNRFIPAFSQFMAATHGIDPNGDPFTAYSRYKGAELLQVATAISSATTVAPDGRKYSIWNVDAIPFVNEHANLNSSSIDVNLDAFRRAAKNDTYADSKTNGKGKLLTAGKTLLEDKVNSLAADMAAVTGNKSSYTFQNGPSNSYTSMNNMTTSWQSAGFGNDAVSNVKLNGSAKERGEALMKAAMAAGITGDELALFMGTCAQESGDFNAYREGKPDIAAYASNKGLGNNGSMDTARKYIGRGPIQLTGLANYQNMSKWLGKDVVANPELLEDTYVGADSAVAYWLNYVRPLVQKKGRQLDPLTASAAVNGWIEDPNAQGGLRTPNGYDVRLRKMQQWAAIINGRAPDPTKGGTGYTDGPTQPPSANPTTSAANDTKADAKGKPGSAPSGGQEVAPAPPPGAEAPANLIRPQGKPTTGGQEVAPRPPSEVISRTSPAAVPQQRTVAAPVQQARRQQQINTETASGRSMPDMVAEQLTVLKEIRDTIREGVNSAKRSGNTLIPNAQANRSPSAPPTDGASVNAQKTPTETAIAPKRAGAPQASSGGRTLPYDVSH